MSDYDLIIRGGTIADGNLSFSEWAPRQSHDPQDHGHVARCSAMPK